MTNLQKKLCNMSIITISQIMNFIAYIKNILLLAFLFVVLMFIYPILAEHTPIHLKYKDGIIYTTQNAMILGIAFSSIFLYVVLKFVYIFIAKTFFIPDAIAFVKKFFFTKKEDDWTFYSNFYFSST